MDNIKALTFDSQADGWDTSKGFTMRQVPMPQLEEAKHPEDAAAVIVKVLYAGVCGSDRGLWYRSAFKDMVHGSLEKEGKTLRILGHEFVGEIIEAGSMVKSLYRGIEVGCLVSGDSHVTCGRCYQCRIGEENVCVNESILGISIDGIFAEYVKIPAKNLWVIGKDGIRPEIAAILDPFGNAVHAATKADMRGQQVAIFGCGPIGLFAVLLARNFGAAKVIAVDVNQTNLDMARQLGAHETIAIQKKDKANGWEPDEEVVARIMELTGGRGADVTMEMAGPASSLNNALQSTRRGGQVILFGIKDGDFTIPNFSRLAVVRGLTLHGVFGRQIFKTWQIADRVLADRKNGVQEKIWEVILKNGSGTILPFAEYDQDAFEAAMNANPKVIFKIHG